MAAALSVRMTTTTTQLLAAVLSLCVVVSLSLRGADAARGTPGDSPIVAISCRELNGDVRLIVTQSLTEFTKMLQIAIGFISKMKSEPKPPSEPQPPPTRTTL